ncbi:MAG: copper chaperone PCu(A)C [Caulobacterales bacterium]|nr:copper chaperone PCu(A)C [Caulobacterales bacterium]
MRRRLVSMMVTVALLAGVPVVGRAQDLPAATASATDPFSPIYPLIGRTWRGTSLGSNAVEDVVRWEWAVGGHAVWAVHSVNNGVYGGETLIFPDRDSGQLIFHYFTSGGFHTTGQMSVTPQGVIEILETVHGVDGLEQLRSTMTVANDGTYRTRSQVERDGAWVEFGGFDYRVDARATVVPPERAGEQGPLRAAHLTISRRLIANPGEVGDVAAYLHIDSAGPADALVEASCSCAERVELHRFDRSGERPAMVTDSRWGVAPEGRLDVRPGSDLHLMLIGFDPARADGTEAVLTLRFEQAGEVAADFELVPDSRSAWTRHD